MKPTEWSVADAKSKLSEVLNRAEKEVQVIRRRDHAYVVMGGEAYEKLTGKARSFLEHLKAIPKGGELEPMPRTQTDLRELDR